MTKICPNCGTENQDSSEFCQNCGNKMEGTVKTSQPNKSTKTGFMGWWDKQTKGIKALSIIGVCCLGLIVIAAIGGTLLPDKTTTNISTPSSTNTTISTPVTNTSTGNTFSNQYVSFNKPSDLTITDHSDDKHLDIVFEQGSHLAGEMSTETLTQDILNTDYPNSLPSISGKSANGYNDETGAGSHITIGTVNGGNFGISTNFNPSWVSDYQMIFNSLVIKKNPPQTQ